MAKGRDEQMNVYITALLKILENPEIKGTRPDLAQARQKRLETNRNYCCKAFKVVA